MGEGILVEIGVEMANAGASAAEIAATLTRRARGLRIYLALDTLEYLKRGGRISGARAAIGTLLSVKPIIEVKAGEVGQADKVRTRGKARERLIELLTARPIERLAVLHSTNADVETFAEALTARAGHRSVQGLDRRGWPRPSGRTSDRAAWAPSRSTRSRSGPSPRRRQAASAAAMSGRGGDVWPRRRCLPARCLAAAAMSGQAMVSPRDIDSNVFRPDR